MKKQNLLVLPAAMLPCIVPAALVLVFLSPEHPFIMGTLFRGNALSLVMSGMATIAAVILAARQRDLPRTQCAWIIAAQFIFCADVAASVLLFRTLKKNHPSSPKEVNP